MSEARAATQKGFNFAIGKFRFCITSIGLDMSNGRRGIFLYYPFTSRHSYKQYKLIKWFLKETK